MNNTSASVFTASLSENQSVELPWTIILPWVVRLRFTISAAQIVIALAVQYLLRIDLPLGWIFLVAALTAISNVAFGSLIKNPVDSRKISPSTLVAFLFFSDTIGLTVLLMLTGGPTNPFTVLYLVYMTVSAATLKSTQTWAIGTFSTFCFGLLFLFYRRIPELEMSRHGSGANLHLIGMWIGFLITIFLVATFAGAMSSLLRTWQLSLLEMQKTLAKKDRLASLATLAAGAAHELNTPLGTIALVAKELEHKADHGLPDKEFGEDCRVIRQGVDRCQQILTKLSCSGPETELQMRENVLVADLLSEIRALSTSFENPVEIIVDDRAPLSSITLLRFPVLQGLQALLKNAMDANPPNAPIHVSVGVRDHRIQFRIQDHGLGMSDETLRRIGEPFFTTKEPGRGMGLGSFLAGAFAEQLGGRLTYRSVLHKGTLAVFEIPLPGDPNPANDN